MAVVNFAAPAPFFPYMAHDLDTSVPLLGQVATLTVLLSASLGLAVGPLAERFGYRPLMTGGMVAVALNLMGTGLTPSYPLLLALVPIGGLGDAALFGLPLAIASTYFAGAARRRAVSWTMAALPAAGVAGIPLLTLIGGAAGWRVAVVCAGLGGLLAAWLTARWLPREAAAPLERIRWRSLLEVYLPLLRRQSLLVLYGATGLRIACWIGIVSYLGAFLTEERDLGPEKVSVAYLLVGVGAVGGSLAAARLGALSPRWVVAAASLALALLCGAVFLARLNALATIALVPLCAVAASVAGVGVALLLADETSTAAAPIMVLNGSVLNVGAAIGLGLGGLLLAVGGYGALGVGLPLFAFFAAGLILAFRPGPAAVDDAPEHAPSTC